MLSTYYETSSEVFYHVIGMANLSLTTRATVSPSTGMFLPWKSSCLPPFTPCAGTELEHEGAEAGESAYVEPFSVIKGQHCVVPDCIVLMTHVP